MRKPGMIQLDVSHFSNVVGAVQRTASLTGGAVRGLPGGVVIDGLMGINSFAAGISEAQKEFQLGRTRTSLDRIKQLENQFNGISGRWSSTVMSVIANARQGRQAIPQQKLNEVKNAQTRMQQLIGPATKAFRDLVTALEHEVTMEGREVATERDTSPQDATPQGQESSEDVLLGEFDQSYRLDQKLKLRRGEDQRVHIVPSLETENQYFIAGFDPPQVVQLTAIHRKSVRLTNVNDSTHQTIESRELAKLIKKGIWLVQLK